MKGSGKSNIKCKGISVDVGTAIAGVWCKTCTGYLIPPFSIVSRSNVEKAPTALSARTRFSMSMAGPRIVKVGTTLRGSHKQRVNFLRSILRIGELGTLPVSLAINRNARQKANAFVDSIGLVCSRSNVLNSVSEFMRPSKGSEKA